MPGQNIVEIGFDIEKLSASKQLVLDQFTDLFKKLDEYDGTRFDPLGKGGLTELRKSIKDGAAAMGEYQAATGKYIQTVTDQVAKQKELAVSYSTASASLKENAALLAGFKLQMQANSDVQKQLKKDFDAGSISLDQYKDKVSDAIKVQFALKQSVADATKEIVNQSRAEFVPANSVDDATAQNKILTKQVSATNVNDVERIAQLNALIDRNNQLIDENSDKLKKQKINIGNYAGAFGGAFNVLKDQLAAVTDQLTQLEAKGKTSITTVGFDPNRFKNRGPNSPTAGDGPVAIATGDAAAYQDLTAKAQVLQSNIERLSVGFKTTKQESRAFAEAASQVGLVLGLQSEEFQTFDKAIGHTQNAMNDIKAASRFQASDAKLIVGLANAASTLAGGFGAAAAASSLFAGDSENLQKEMAQFQQLLVLINGLQAVANGLQAEAGGMQLLLSARTNLLNAAKATQLLLTTRAIQVIAAETTETAVNAEVKEVATVATGEMAVAEGAQTAAIAANTEVTIANTAAQAAAKGAGLGTIAIAAGIAAVAIGAGIALALLTAKLFGYKGAAGLTTDQQKELAKATGDLNEALNQQAKVLDDLDVSQKRYYTNLIQNAQDAGASQYALLLAQERFDKVQADAAKLEVDRLGATNAAYSKQTQQVQQLLGLQQLANEEVKKISAIPEKDQTRSQKKSLEADLKLLEVYSAQLGPEQKRLDDMRTAREKLVDFTQKATSDETKFNKLSLDDQLDAAEKAEELRANLVKARNAIILGADKSTLEQRITAIKSNVTQENAILTAQAKKITDNPANKINGLLTPQAQGQINALNEKRKEGVIKGLEDETKTRRQYYERDRDANLEIYRSQQEEQAKIDQEVLSRQIGPGAKGTTGDKKLNALTDQYNRERNQLDAQQKNDLDKQGLTDAERNAIHQKYNDQFLDQDRKFLDNFKNLQEEIRQATIAAWDLFYERRKNQITKTEADQISALNQASEKKLVTDREYGRQRQKIEDEAALNIALTEARNAKVKVDLAPAGTKERADAEADYTAKRKGLSNQIKKNDDDTDKARLDKTLNTLSDIKAAYSNMVGATSEILNIGWNTQKMNLEKLEAQQQKSHEADITRITGSTISEQEKTNMLMILDKQRQSQKEINDRKARQIELEKARFDKAASIANITLSTAEAIVGFLHNPGGIAGIALSVSAGILGATQLAAAIATPLPKYKHGAGIPGQPEHPGGLAVVGDAFEKELIKEPGKRPYWSPAVPTTLSLQPHTQVMPLSRISEMISQGMFVNQSGILLPQQVDNTAELRDLKNTIIWQTGELKQAVKNSQRPIIVRNNIGRDMAHQAWINKNVRD